MYCLCWAYGGKRKDKLLPRKHAGLQDRVCEVGARLRQELACRGAGDGCVAPGGGWSTRVAALGG